MPTKPSGTPQRHEFDAAAAAEATAMNISLSSTVTMKAEALAADLRRLPAPTIYANQIIEICDRPKPDLQELRQTLLDQCHELNAAKQRQPEGIGRRNIGQHADQCHNIAADGHRATRRTTAT